MNRIHQAFLLFVLLLPTSAQIFGQEPESQEMAEAIDVATQLAGISSEQFLEMVKKSQQSVVVVEMEGRDGKPLGIGSGFILSEDGLIATNLHVIGEARPVRVRLYDEREFPVTQIHGTNSTQDVAVITIEAENLTPLKLGKPDSLKQGQPVFALGNPWGLEHSVVTGVVSGFRDHDDGMSLIQLAIPIEKGNSGGPVMDMQGRVHGLMTLKSQVTDNLGYAVKASAVRDLLDSPNPIPMSRWMTIGALNSRLWEPGGDVNWKHRSGVISVSGSSRGFGGRAVCLSKQTLPELPFELAVDVKIEEEDGAAGLLFHSDGGDVHYGFYASSGSLRLTRFDGPTVYSWHVLKEVRSRHFQADEWNRLKVRLTENTIECFCNDERVLVKNKPKLTGGRIGIVKFRHTTAQFKRFAFASELKSEKPSEETQKRVIELANGIEHRRPPEMNLIEKFTDFDQTGLKSIRSQAKILEQRAEHLRQLAKGIHEQQIRDQLLQTLHPEGEEPADLFHACLLISKLDNAELIPEEYEKLLDQMVEEFLELIPEDAGELLKITKLQEYLFQQQGFHGSRTNYYHASNSYINEAIDDREGLPLTLSILYIEFARRAGLDSAGIGLPGHFIARVVPADGKPMYIDAFEGGNEMTLRECRQKVRDFSGFPWSDTYLDPQPAEAIIQRMLRNLIRVANETNDLEAALRYVRTILAINPDSVDDRLYKSVLCLRTNRFEEGLTEAEFVLKEAPEGIELQRVRELRDAFLEKLSDFD